ncbi:hypothetical protein, partial [Pseudomonas syringae]|uniref:hypothetical protein n=1 Tax=Pseudomonas syringae TaxID=317 RepID=UPI001E437D86
MNILIDGEGSDQKWVKPRSALAKLQKLSFLRERYKAAKCCRAGVFQGSCRVSRLTMPLFSQPVALDPDS